MNIGFDFWNVITQFPREVKILTDFLSSHAGVNIYIISAIGDRSLKKYNSTIDEYKKHIESYNINAKEIIVVHSNNDEDFAALKLRACQERLIDIFLDDRPSTIKLLHENGIMALQVLKPIKK